MDTDEGARAYSSPTLDADTSFLLARASAMASAVGNRAIADLGLKVRTYSVLAVAVEVAPSQRELAERLRLDPSQIVALVDELETRGLLERRQDPTDRRARIVAATPAGVTLFEQARARIEDAQRDLWAPHSAAEVEALRALLRRVAYADLP
ncbi:MarR family winged helix-turn-helix transcriptional regulator [Demequina phytophila]|uniref:MarR family winged helix-turn-helix transcriptional regulator n=1 Tax=Demequina phytophila TaxID=1638981 RepID=UPI0007825736|nr:MarR family transcriptional regulator [Demequina phytophila]